MSASAVARAAAALALLLSLAPRTAGQDAKQAPPSRTLGKPASTVVHDAWLAEVLDLDVGTAVAKYRAVVEQVPANQPERWLAVGRLAELRRMGIESATAGDFRRAPEEVRTAARSLDVPLDVAHLAAPEALAPAARVPPVHPATQLIQQWVRGQLGPSPEDRLRLRREAFRLRSADDSRSYERWQAADILSVELRGRLEQARALRELYFEEWRAPQPAGTPDQLVARVRSNLQAWLDAEDTTPSQRGLLRRLQEAIEQRAADPAAVLEFVARLPLYADRLLAEPASPGDGAPREAGARETSAPEPGARRNGR